MSRIYKFFLILIIALFGIKDVNAFKIEDLKEDKNNEKKKKGCC